MNAPNPPNPPKVSFFHGFFEALIVLLLLPATSLAVLWFWALPAHEMGRSEIKIPMLISLASASALMLFSSKFPALLQANRAGFPRAFAAPAVHASFTALLSALSTTAPVGIQRAPDALMPAAVWLDARALLFSAAGQIGVLILLALVQRRIPVQTEDNR